MPRIEFVTHIDPRVDRIRTFAQEQLRGIVCDLLDDPSHLVHPDEEQGAGERIAYYRMIAADLGLDFDALCRELGTPFEQQRLHRIETQSQSQT